ncbi:hypothetical protein EGW08_001036 [Elysia chlorotica]|uniref:Uncharacterized protein n=1 Tax=Elysia chlorotica TaxID=188477 RepID=A0A3S1I2Z4_ELYCH|nr:hypothetical protein EGW08_001036 [Elysia chlorotica]
MLDVHPHLLYYDPVNGLFDVKEKQVLLKTWVDSPTAPTYATEKDPTRSHTDPITPSEEEGGSPKLEIDLEDDGEFAESIEDSEFPSSEVQRESVTGRGENGEHDVGEVDRRVSVVKEDDDGCRSKCSTGDQEHSDGDDDGEDIKTESCMMGLMGMCVGQTRVAGWKVKANSAIGQDVTHARGGQELTDTGIATLEKKMMLKSMTDIAPTRRHD